MPVPQPIIQEVASKRRPSSGAEVIVRESYNDLQFRPSITGWTPDLINEAGAAADLGNLRVLSDLVDAMMADDRVDGALQTLTLGMHGLPLQFEGGDPELIEQLKSKGKSGIGGEWNCMLPQTELVKLEGWAIMAGYGLAQRKPLPRLAGQPQRFRLKTWNPRCLSYDFNAVSGSHWRVQTKQGMKPVIPGGQFVLYLPFGEQRPWNEGKWRRCAFPWIVKRFALEDRANQGEVVGSPTWVGKSTQGGTERQRQRFLDQLRALGRNGRIVLPEGWELDLKEATGKTYEIFSESTEWADQAITISIISQVSSIEGSPGFDSGKPQDQILNSVTTFYAKSLAQCLYEQALRPWAQANTGDADSAPCGYWVTERANSQASQATTLETIGRAVVGINAAFKDANKQVDVAAMSAQYGIPLIDLAPQEADSGGVTLAPTDLAAVVRVNEARSSVGLGPLTLPDGSRDPDGDLTIAAFNAKHGAVPAPSGGTGLPSQRTPPAEHGKPGPPTEDA